MAPPPFSKPPDQRALMTLRKEEEVNKRNGATKGSNTEKQTPKQEHQLSMMKIKRKKRKKIWVSYSVKKNSILEA